jgi:16S rRNA (guanine527-N7)-methyltransferase
MASALALDALWAALGWQPSSTQMAQLKALQVELRGWNQRVNLTRLVEGDDYWIAQVFDSLWPLAPWLAAGESAGTTEALRVIDIGTGGGFPGLAAAIALPGARLTLVDSVGRKLEAVRAMAAAIGLADRVTLRCERAERSGHQRDERGSYQLALARAVAAAPVVAEYLVPLLAPEGRALLYRGQWSPADQGGIERAIGPLKATISRQEQRELPGDRGLRTLIELAPASPCPRTYPRAVGIPAKQPLG